MFLRNEPDWKMRNFQRMYQDDNDLEFTGRFFESGSFFGFAVSGFVRSGFGDCGFGSGYPPSLCELRRTSPARLTFRPVGH
jgi:hypothetical protein